MDENEENVFEIEDYTTQESYTTILFDSEFVNYRFLQFEAKVCTNVILAWYIMRAQNSYIIRFEYDW